MPATNTLTTALGGLLALALLVGCTSVPRIEPDYLGASALENWVSDEPSGSSAAELPKIAADGPEPYRLGPGDEISVVVWGRPDLGSEGSTSEAGTPVSRVDEDGEISLPFVGEVPVGGKTIDETIDDLRTRFSAVVDNPQVFVELESCHSRSILLRGAFESPGVHGICGPTTIGEAIRQGEGFAEDADLTRGALIRDGAPFSIDYSFASDREDLSSVLVMAGDTLYFPSVSERVVYIFGEVPAPGLVPMEVGGQELLEVLAEAGGLIHATSRSEAFYLVRPAADSTAVFELSFSELLVGEPVWVQDGDRIFIPPTKLARWNRWWRQALPAFIFRAATP